jgi:hypothetical protein
MDMWASDAAVTAEADTLANILNAQMSQVGIPPFLKYSAKVKLRRVQWRACCGVLKVAQALGRCPVPQGPTHCLFWPAALI